VIVLLNGAASAGKTSTAQALQLVWERPLLHTGIDLFSRMLPENRIGFDAAPGSPAAEGFSWHTGLQEGQPVMRLQAGPVAEKLMRDMRRVIARMAELGNDVVVDEMLLERHWVADYLGVLAAHEVWLIGLRCPLQTLVLRERERGRRVLGQARATAEAAHAHCAYDLEVDSERYSPMECAQQILAHVRQGPPSAFADLRRRAAGHPHLADPLDLA
jgi:chloramphenicol 3-O phosphotransferase